MKNIVGLSCFFTVGCLLGSAGLLNEASAEELVDVSEQLAEIRDQHDMPGMVVLGMKGGEVRVVGADGVRSTGSQEAITTEDKVHIGSCGKAMTATMIAVLVEEGVITWDTTIAEGLPKLKDQIHPGFHQVTLLQLLQHRGGIAERKSLKLNSMLMGELSRLEGEPVECRREAVTKVLAEAPVAQPGASMEYSNYGYMTAAAMVEARTGKPWRQLMHEKLFKPLGMKSAGFELPGNVGVVDQPRGHRRPFFFMFGNWQAVEPEPGNDLPTVISPAGLIHLSMSDWAKFVQTHLDGANGVDSVIKAKTFQTLQTPAEGDPYAGGWVVVERGWSKGPVLTHDGSNNAWYSVVWASPGSNLFGLAVVNAADNKAPQALDQAVSVTLQKLFTLPTE